MAQRLAIRKAYRTFATNEHTLNRSRFTAAQLAAYQGTGMQVAWSFDGKTAPPPEFAASHAFRNPALTAASRVRASRRSP